MSIGQRISHLRKHNAMTQEELADVLGTTRQAISKWESGKSLPDIDYVIKIGEHFGVSMDYLLLGRTTSQDQLHSETEPVEKTKIRIPSLYVILSSIGILFVLLLPLSAQIYRNYVFSFEGSAYTNPNIYLTEWPLLGVVLLSIFLITFGLGGVIKFYSNKSEATTEEKR